MATVALYPAPSVVTVDEYGNPFPSTGLVVRMNAFYEEACRDGLLVRDDPNTVNTGTAPGVVAPITLALVTTQLAAYNGQRDQQYVTTTGYATPGDSGGGTFVFALGVSSGANGYTKINAANGQWKIVEDARGLSARQFGVTDNVVNTAAWNAWLNIVSTDSVGKLARLTAGSYLIANNAVNITSVSGFSIVEDAGASVRFDPAAYVSNRVEQVAYYAQNCTGLRIQLGNSGAVCRAILDTCTDSHVLGGSTNGRITDVTGTFEGYHFPNAVLLKSCVRCTVSGGTYGNVNDAVMLSGTNANRSKYCQVTGNSFYKDSLNSRPGSDFPTGVYVFFADSSAISSNSFKNICSRVNGGNKGTGMGFGIYEGDGGCSSLIVGANEYVLDRGDGYGMCGLYFTTTKNLELSGGVYTFSSTNSASVPISGDAIQQSPTDDPGPQQWSIRGGVVKMAGGTQRFAVQIGTTVPVTTDLTYAQDWTVSGVKTDGGIIQIARSNAVPLALSVVSNEAKNSTDHGIQLVGNVPIINARVEANRVERAQYSGIILSGCQRTQVLGNKVFDCNQANELVDDAKNGGIVFADYSWGASIYDNHVENRTGAGNMKRPIHNRSSTQRGAWKFDDSNTSAGFPALIPTMYENFSLTAPAGGWDYAQHDRYVNPQTAAAGTPEWHNVYRAQPTLGAAFSSGTTVTLSSTAGIVAGNAIQFVVSESGFDDNFAVSTYHYYGVVLSITDGTHLQLTAALPGGYSFPTGAPVRAYTWKAAAAIAA